jgi:hypothetical protein
MADDLFYPRKNEVDADSALKIVKELQQVNDKDRPKTVVNPTSFLRFLPGGEAIRKLEIEKKLSFEKEGERDLAKELERGLVGGGAKTVSSLLEFITIPVDTALDTNLTSKLDQVTRKFVKEHGDPDTLAGEVTDLLTQYGVGGGIVLKVIGQIGKLKKIKNLNQAIDKTIKKLPKVLAGTAGVTRKVGTGAFALGITDLTVSSSDRDTFFVNKVSEEGKSGRDLSVARLINKLKFAQEGAIIGGGIPIVGKALSLGARFGLYTGKTAFGIGAKTADALIVNPVSKLVAFDPVVIPSIAKTFRAGTAKLGDVATRGILTFSDAKIPKSGLPPFKDWRTFSVHSGDDLRRVLKKIDNVLGKFRSMGQETSEQFAITQRGEKEIRAKARKVEQLVKSLERKNYQLVKAFENQYNTLKTSPAAQEKYLDEVIEYLEGKRSLDKIQKTLKPTAKSLKGILDDTTKTFAEFLPDDSALKAILSSTKGYVRKSFGVFTNPNYAVDEKSETFKNAIKFVRKIIDKNISMREVAAKTYQGSKAGEARDLYAKDLLKNILRYAKTDGKDPIVILSNISKKLDLPEQLIATGEELPDVLRKFLGEEKSLKNQVLQTISSISTQNASRTTYDRLATTLKNSGLAFETEEAAKAAFKSEKIINIGPKLPGLGLLKSSISDLYTSPEIAIAMRNVDGPLDFLLKSGLYNKFLQLKTAAQYGKTVLSPATQTRNFSSAAGFVVNRGLIGNRASLTDSVKLVADDIFNVGKTTAEREKAILDSIEEGIKYGVLDENIVASELQAVIRAIQKGNITNADNLAAFLEKYKVTETAGRIYAGSDNIWKWYAYNWYKSFLSDYAGKNLGKMTKWFDEVAGQRLSKTKFDGTSMDLDEAIKQASSWYVKNTMPTYSLVPDLIKGIRLSPFGNFVSFPAEIIRTSVNTLRTNLREISSTDRTLRAMGYRGAMGQFTMMGGAGLAVKEIGETVTGIAQEAMNDYRQYLAPEYQRNNILVPISKVDENGIFKLIDFSTFFPYDAATKPFEIIFREIANQKLNPRQIDDLLIDIFFGPQGVFMETIVRPFLSEPIGGEILMDVIFRDGVSRKGTRIYGPKDSFQEKVNKIMGHLIRSVEPGVVTTGRQLYYGLLNKLTPTGYSYDAEDVAFGLGTGIKPQKVDLKKQLDFTVGEFTKIRTDVAKDSDLYKFNMNSDDIVKEYIRVQKNAFREQRKIYNSIQTYIKLGYDEFAILEELESRKGISSDQIRRIMDGEFMPVNYSETRFNEKIKDVERQEEIISKKKGISPRMVNEDEAFPVYRLDDVKYQLDGISLKEDFPMQEAEEEGGLSSLPVEQPAQVAQAKPVTPPLPQQPQPVLQATTPQLDPTTGLTRTETALLSPSEQAIRQRQRT